MAQFDKMTLETFLEKQLQLFEEQVAENTQEALAFLDENLAVVVKSVKEVKEYLEDCGLDAYSMTDEEILDASEVFPLKDGRFLVVAG